MSNCRSGTQGLDDRPLVTIITPAYNRASYLDETIQSVLGQDYPNLEYIVLDDGSTDNTREVMAGYDGRIRWESHANMGETRTVNKGFSMANGEIIGVVNSDDPLLPGAITALVSRLMSDPELLVVYPDWDYIDKDGKFIEHVNTPEYSYMKMLRNFQCVPSVGTLFRRKVVEMTGGRDENFRYVADLDFWLRAGMRGPFARLPKTLATFRVHPDSASVNQMGTRMSDEHLLLVNKIYSMPEMPPEAFSFKIRRGAYSNAYCSAAVNCGEGMKRLVLRYLLTSLYYAPWNYLGENAWKLDLVLTALFGRHYKTFRPFFRRVYRLVKANKLPFKSRG